MGDQADGRIGQLGPDRAETVGGISDSGVEGPVGEEDEEQVVCWVYPDLCAGEASMAVCRLTDEGTIEARLILIELGCVPPQQPRAAVGARREKSLDRAGGYPWTARAGTIAEPDLGIPSQVHSG